MAVAIQEKADMVSPPPLSIFYPEPEEFPDSGYLQRAIHLELDTILASSSFRTSRKSCEFLRYIVQVTLDGQVDSLKERSIGMDLLGRDVSYDPSSDATVRVRANEVRKRLTSFYSTYSPVNGYRIELLPGSYTPKFIRSTRPPSIHVQTHAPIKSASEREYVVKPMSVLKMALPALIAFFLCSLFLRQQIQSADPYHQFWNQRLRGRAVMLLDMDEAQATATPSASAGQAMLPMIWLAGRYDLQPIMQSQAAKNDDKQEAYAENAVILHGSEATPAALAANRHLRYTISTVRGMPRLIDSLNPVSEESAHGSSALLTLLPEDPSVLWLSGTDWKAISTLVQIISTKNEFPSRLNTEAEAGRVVQAVWQSTPSPHLEIYAH